MEQPQSPSTLNEFCAA